jgi:hypothetical protein
MLVSSFSEVSNPIAFLFPSPAMVARAARRPAEAPRSFHKRQILI